MRTRLAQGNVFKSFAPRCAELAKLDRSAILDGEIVCLDSVGKPQFYDLLRRHRDPIFYALDALWLDGEDLVSSSTPALNGSEDRAGIPSNGRPPRIDTP